MRDIDRIDSWLFWKSASAILSKWPRYVFPQPYWVWRAATGDICPICDGNGEVTYSGDVYDCLCMILRWQESVEHEIRDLRSFIHHRSIDDLSMKDKTFADAVLTVTEWSRGPSGALVISGHYGCGKTELLALINTALNPIALYVTMSDFEHSIFSRLGDNSLSKYIDSLSKSPILLLDDYGMEYGSELVRAQFMHVIDNRYRGNDLFPIAVATNMNMAMLETEDRVGSRLLQRDRLTFIDLSSVSDYRLESRRKR